MPKFLVEGARFLIDADSPKQAIEQLETRTATALPDMPLVGILAAREVPTQAVPRIPAPHTSVHAEDGSVAAVNIYGPVGGHTVVGDGNTIG